MSLELARRLVAAGALADGELRTALLRHVNGKVALVSALVANGHLTDDALEKAAGVAARAETPLKVARDVLESLPDTLCAFALAVPLAAADAQAVETFACVDPSDPHLVGELVHHLGRPVRLVYAPLAAVQQALRRVGRSTSQRPPSHDPRGTTDRPMLLVPRTSRVSRVAKGPQALDERGEHATPVTPADVPRAPAVPNFGASRKSSGRRTRGDSAAPARRPPPVSPRAPLPPFASVDSVVRAMRLAATRDEVMDGLLVAMSTVARRVALFAVKKQGFRGIACNAAFGDGSRLRDVEIALSPPSIFTIALSGSAYLGPLPATPVHLPLRNLLDTCTYDVMVTLVKVAGRAAVVLFADELGDALLASARAGELAAAAGDALSRIVADLKSGSQGRP